MAVRSASKGILKLLNFIKQAYGIDDTNSTLAKKVISFLYTALLIILISLVMLLKIYGQKILEIINDLIASLKLDLVLDKFSRIFDLINGIFPLLLVALALTFLYKKAADSESSFNISYKEAFLGGGFASVAIYLVSFLYSFFLENLSSMSLIYGALAGIIALLLRLLLFSYIIILGAEIIGAYRFVNESNMEVGFEKRT
jgi:membrane protein